MVKYVPVRGFSFAVNEMVCSHGHTFIQQMGKFLCSGENFMFTDWFGASRYIGAE